MAELEAKPEHLRADVSRPTEHWIICMNGALVKRGVIEIHSTGDFDRINLNIR